MGRPDWVDDSSADDWDDFVAHVRRSTVKQMAESAFVISLLPTDGEPDIKIAVELGLALLMDKPIVAVATNGGKVPRALARIAQARVEVGDIDTEAGQLELQRKLDPILKRMAR